MSKYLLALALFFSGCSYFTINGSMCDQIASDPHATVPKECRNYSEEAATKATNNTKTNQSSSDEDIIKFQKSQE